VTTSINNNDHSHHKPSMQAIARQLDIRATVFEAFKKLSTNFLNTLRKRPLC